MQKFQIVFFLVCCSVLASYSALAQESILNKRVTITLHSLTVPAALKRIEEVSSVRFFYTSDLFSQTRVNCSSSNQTLDVLLQCLFANQSVSYRVVQDKIFIYKTPISESPQQTNISQSKKSFKTDTLIDLNLVKEQSIISDTNSINSIEFVEVTKETSLYVVQSQEDIDSIVKVQKIEPVFEQQNSTYSNNMQFFLRIVPFVSCNYTFEQVKISNLVFADRISTSEAFIPWSYDAGIHLNFMNKHVGFETGASVSNFMWNASIKTYSEYKTDSIVEYIQDTTWDVQYYKKPDHPEQSEATTVDSTMIITRTPLYYTYEDSMHYYNNNSLSYIRIPFGAAYQYIINDAHSIMLGVSANLHVLYAAKGYSYGIETNSVFRLNSVFRDYFVSIMPYVSYSYGINSNIGVFMRSGYTRSISETVREGFDYQRIFNQIFVSAAIYYEL